MATPIAHKGVVAGAKVQAMTMLDILLHPELVKPAWDYFNNVQTKDIKYKSFLRPDDKPAIWLNEKTMAKYRDRMKKFYYDPTSTTRTWSSSESSTRPSAPPVQAAATPSKIRRLETDLLRSLTRAVLHVSHSTARQKETRQRQGAEQVRFTHTSG